MKFIISLFNIIIIFAVVLFIVRIFSMRKFLRKINVKCVLFIYAALLVAFVPILYMLQGKNFLHTASRNEIEEFNKLPQDCSELAIKNKLDSTPFLRLNCKKMIEYGKNKLNIQPSTEEGSLYIYAKRKDVDDCKILLKYYSMNSYFNSINLTDRIIPNQIELDGDSLKIQCPYQDLSKNYNTNARLNMFSSRYTPINSIRFYKFINDLTVRQFTGDSYYNASFIREVGILYLDIPKTLQIEKAPPVNYIN